MLNKKKKLSRKYYIIGDESPFYIKESFKATRTNLMSILSVYDGPKQMCFTSPQMGDGKTSTCTNVAVTFAQTGAKVLLIDADMRKPKIHRVFKLDSAPGLSECLGGFVTDKNELIQKTTCKGLDVIAAGKIPPNPTELILSSNFDKMLEMFADIYDYVFIDAPPACVVTDAVIISRKTLGAILICRCGETRKDVLINAKSEIEQGGGRILGAILNGVDYGKKSSQSYKYSYKYGYNYYNIGYADSVDDKGQSGKTDKK